MTVITTRIHVAPDGVISGRAPDLPPGEHEAAVIVAEPATADRTPGWPGKPFTMENFPIHDEPWDDSISLRREDMYDDEGRLR